MTNYGRELATGMIVRFNSPEINFDEALSAGPDHMMEYFSEVIGGLCIGHVKELQELSFFSFMEKLTGLNVDLGSWEEIPVEQMDSLLEILNFILPKATEGLQKLLEDLKEMILLAKNEGSSIAFMLAE